MRARIILRSIDHKCFPKKQKKKVFTCSQKSHMRLRSRGLPTYGLTLNLYTLFFALSLALLPPLPCLLTFLTVHLPGNRLRFMPLTRDLTFPFLSQRPCVAEPEATSLSSAEPRALWSLTRPCALLSLPWNFLWLPPILPHLLPLAQTKLPIPCYSTFLALAWIFFSTSSIFPGLHILFLPSGRYLPLFPFTRWESLSTFLLP